MFFNRGEVGQSQPIPIAEKMNSAIFKATNTNNLNSSLRALFHSTLPLQRQRRNYWDSSWEEGINKDSPSSSRGTSWFKKQYSDGGSGRYRNGNRGSSHWYKRDSLFCEDDFDVENIFRSTFGGNIFFYWPFINEENPQCRMSERFSNFWKSWNWRYQSENNYDSACESDYDSTFESDSSDSYDSASESDSSDSYDSASESDSSDSYDSSSESDSSDSYDSASESDSSDSYDSASESDSSDSDSVPDSSERFSNFGKSWNWRYQSENNYYSASESDSSDSDLDPDRLTLGLSASGPLKLEDVKKAYRQCALKWHPDRHQGSSKAIAEEKFKRCNAAYQSLCDKMAKD